MMEVDMHSATASDDAPRQRRRRRGKREQSAAELLRADRRAARRQHAANVAASRALLGRLEAHHPLMSIYVGRRCIGFVLARGREGFEAFDRRERSLGLYPSRVAAVAAIPDTAKAGATE
jgi:hypothetical protein